MTRESVIPAGTSAVPCEIGLIVNLWFWGKRPMTALSYFASWLSMPAHTGAEKLGIGLRWVHFAAGITWIGLLYFFNLINVPFMKQVDAGMQPKVFQYLTLPALQLFRWSALLTLFVGFWSWSQF